MKRLFIIMVMLSCCLSFPWESALQAQEAGDRKPPVSEKEPGKAAVPAEVQKTLDEQRKTELAEALTGIRDSISALQKGQADAGADMTTIGDQIRKLRGDIEEIGKNVESLRSERTNFEGKWKELLSRIRVIEDVVGLRGGKIPEEQKRSEEKPAASTGVKDAASGMALYDEAFGDFREGRYEDARGKFQKFLEQHPDSPSANAAQFWIGECYYLENSYEKAILEYDKVIKNYPEGDKVPPAMLKQGLSFYKLGDAASARLLFRRLIDEFPETRQAQIAKQRLNTIQPQPQAQPQVPPQSQPRSDPGSGPQP